MPGRNILKQDVADSYYHVYARGNSKQEIYLEPEDYAFFLSVIKRHLSKSDTSTSERGVPYKKLHESIEVLAYCLMPNHFHMLVYQVQEGAMQNLMHRVMNAYGSYFNRKYERSGRLFESRYRASMVTTDPYLLHISRYIHLNPANWREYDYSSLRSYLGHSSPDWLSIDKILQLYTSKDHYLEFLEDYQEARNDLAIIKHELADH